MIREKTCQGQDGEKQSRDEVENKEEVKQKRKGKKENSRTQFPFPIYL